MTNKERLISLIGFAAKDDAIEGELIDQGVTGSDSYNGSKLTELKTGALNLLKLIISTPDVEDDNGTGFTTSTKFDRSAVLERIKQLEDELGLSVGSSIEAKPMW